MYFFYGLLPESINKQTNNCCLFVYGLGSIWGLRLAYWLVNCLYLALCLVWIRRLRLWVSFDWLHG